jgi:hypothetical protein
MTKIAIKLQYIYNSVTYGCYKLVVQVIEKGVGHIFNVRTTLFDTYILEPLMAQMKLLTILRTYYGNMQT